MVLSTPAACDYLADQVRVAPAVRPDRQSAGRAVLVLERAGLLTIDRTTTPPMVRISPVLQSALRAMMPEAMLEHAARVAADALTEAWPRDEPTGWLAESLRSCAASLSQAAGDLLWAGGCHPVLQRAGQSLDDAHLTGPAADYWRDLASVSERLLGADHPHTLAAVQRLDQRLPGGGPGPPTPSGGCSGWWSAAPAASAPAITRSWWPGVISVTRWSPPASYGTRSPSWTRWRVTTNGCMARTISTRWGRAMSSRPPTWPQASPRTAAGLYRRTLSGPGARPGIPDAETLTTRQGLADASLAAGQVKDAISAYKKVLAGRERPA